MVEQIRISPEEVRGYGNICEGHTLEDFIVSNSGLAKEKENVHGALTEVYKLVYSVYGLMFDFDKGNKQLYLQMAEADTLSFGFDTVNKQLYLVDENDTGFNLGFDEDTNELYITDDAPPIVHNYTLALDSESYTTTGSLSVSATLLDDGVAVSGATISFTGGTSTVTATTDSSGVATATVNFTSSGTLTATYSNVSDTATVTVQTYLFYDDCTSESTLSHYGTYISLRDSGTSAMTQNGTKHKLTITHQGQSFIPITDLNGIRDSFKLTITSQSTSANSVYCGIGLCLYIDDNNWYSVEDTSSAIWTYKKVNGTFTYNQGSRTAQYEGVKLIQEFIYDASTNKVTLNRYDSNMNLIQSKTQSVPSTLTSTIKWGFSTDWTKDSYVSLEEVKAEYI